MVEAMRDYAPGDAPSREKIEDVLGPIKVPPTGVEPRPCISHGHMCRN